MILSIIDKRFLGLNDKFGPQYLSGVSTHTGRLLKKSNFGDIKGNPKPE